MASTCGSGRKPGGRPFAHSPAGSVFVSGIARCVLQVKTTAESHCIASRLDRLATVFPFFFRIDRPCTVSPSCIGNGPAPRRPQAHLPHYAPYCRGSNWPPTHVARGQQVFTMPTCWPWPRRSRNRTALMRKEGRSRSDRELPCFVLDIGCGQTGGIKCITRILTCGLWLMPQGGSASKLTLNSFARELLWQKMVARTSCQPLGVITQRPPGPL